MSHLTGITPGPYAVELIDPDFRESDFGEWMIVAPADPALPMTEENSLTVAIIVTTKETADLFAGSGDLLEAAKGLLGPWGSKSEQWDALRGAVERCEGRQP